MFIKQLSVFIENKEGRLVEVLDVLKKEQVSVISLSLADTSEYGLLRMITDRPQAGQAALKEKGFSAMLSDVLAVKLSHHVGSLQEILSNVGGPLSVKYLMEMRRRSFYKAKKWNCTVRKILHAFSVKKHLCTVP